MALRPASADRPIIRVPDPEADHPSWTKVGVIAVVGFVIGVAWPRLAGVRLGPSVPDLPASVSSAPADPTPSASTSSSATNARVSPATSATTSPASAAVIPAGGSSTSTPPSTTTVDVSVARGYVFGCETTDGDHLKGGECGSLSGLDGVVLSRLRRLSDCPAAPGAPGKLRLVLKVDFVRSTLATDLGRGQTGSSADGLLACARSDLSGVSVAGIAHDHSTYSVSYAVFFTRSGSPTAPAAVMASTAEGSAPGGSAPTAQVEWDVAIVRDAPKSGKVVARLPRGTTLRVGLPKDGWWPVKYGDGYTNDGWVYRGAIGR
jgi:hypothetical protein